MGRAAWRLGVALAPGFGRARRESDPPQLANLRVATDAEGEDQGTLASFDVSARYRATSHITFSAGPGITWADDDYVMTFFGVGAS